MHPLEILEFPDPRLRTVASPVKNMTDEVAKFAESLLFTMYDAAHHDKLICAHRKTSPVRMSFIWVGFPSLPSSPART